MESQRGIASLQSDLSDLCESIKELKVSQIYMIISMTSNIVICFGIFLSFKSSHIASANELNGGRRWWEVKRR